ncbi:hypothetical protein EI94DRAFT_1735933 [Lactarius quietus]|nr:hypothetical protein EI94DRAFT_1735933 [Lactarius quietus]
MKFPLVLASTAVFLPIIVDVAPSGSLVYNPANITAANGTSVTFERSSFCHTIYVRKSCTYLAAANGSSGGFDSGLQAKKEFTITITNDQEPIWFFCKESDHCGLGMVSDGGPVTGGVNAVATSTPTATSPSSSSSSDAGRLVASSFFALLATTLGISLA